MSATRLSLFITLTLAVSASGTLARAQSPEPAVQRAIDSYEPAWAPPKGDLDGAVIAVNPRGGGSDSKAQQSLDDLALHTAMHLHHLVRFAGGRTIDMRVDDRPVIDRGQVIERCHHANAILLLSVVYGEPPARSNEPPGDALSVELARSIASEDGVSVAYPDGWNGLAAPAVTVCLPVPGTGESAALRCRSDAVMLYGRIAAYVRKHHPPTTGEARDENDGTAPSFVDSRTERRKKLDRFARTIWPEGDLPVEKAEWFAEIFSQVALSDRTGVYYRPVIAVDGDRVTVAGATSVAGMLETMPAALRAVGVRNVRNEMRRLPDTEALGETLFGVCVAPMARTLSRPEPGAVPQTQLLFGEPVFLLDVRDSFLLVQAGDGYWGWVRGDSIHRMNREAFLAYTEPEPAVLVQGIQRSGLRIPMGARLPVVSRENEGCTVMLPDGRQFRLTNGEFNVFDERSRTRSVVQSALQLLYTPYVFGGRSPIGMDCSGLVTNLYSQQDLNTARDASQQFVSGRLVATDWYREGIRAGDLLYFINDTGKIYHTGIAVSPTHFIHACPPEVQIGSLVEGDRLYHAMSDRSFLAAKRP